MLIRRVLICFVSAVFVCQAESPDLERINRSLALDLVHDMDYDGAAIEFRRLSLMSVIPADRDGYRWFSAYYYLEDENPEVAAKILDTIEQHGEDFWKADLLRASAAEQMNRSGEETFYLSSVYNQDALSEAEADYVTRRLASAMIRAGKTNEARKVLMESGMVGSEELRALDDYMDGKDKSPALGGWLGLIPGAGYAYAGEYGNAVRSLILNGLFIYGMIQSADDDEWGAFAIISFFEITWYTGSIYGGIDSSHRYNIRRKQRLLDAVSAGVIMEPDVGEVPAVSLKFRF